MGHANKPYHAGDGPIGRMGAAYDFWHRLPNVNRGEVIDSPLDGGVQLSRLHGIPATTSDSVGAGDGPSGGRLGRKPSIYHREGTWDSLTCLVPIGVALSAIPVSEIRVAAKK